MRVRRGSKSWRTLRTKKWMKVRWLLIVEQFRVMRFVVGFRSRLACCNWLRRVEKLEECDRSGGIAESTGGHKSVNWPAQCMAGELIVEPWSEYGPSVWNSYYECMTKCVAERRMALRSESSGPTSKEPNSWPKKRIKSQSNCVRWTVAVVGHH